MPEQEITLISHKLCPFVQRARIVLDEKRIPHQIRFIDLSNKPDWFIRLSPLGKVPVLLVDGRRLFESAPIAEYLDETTPGSMHPADPFDKAEHRAWIEYASNTLGLISSFYSAPDTASLDRAVDGLHNRFVTLNQRLSSGPYFNGAGFSLVDAAFAPVFRYFDVIDDYIDLGLDDMERLRLWRSALARRPSVRHAVVSDYYERLRRFFLNRDTAFARMITTTDAA